MEFYDGLLSALPLPLPALLAQVDPEVVAVPVPVAQPVTVPVVQGPQFFIALLSGVILAFGFQLLITNLSMAVGVSYAASSSGSSSSSDSGSSADGSSSGSTIKTIGIAFGLWTLISVSLSLFFASWLATSLTAYNNPFLGAVTGLVIWATYFTMLMWFSSTAVGSLIGSVVRSATSSFQSLFGTAAAAIGAKTAGNQVIQTAEAAAAAVRQELMGEMDTTGIRENLEEYIASLKSPGVDVSSVEQEFESLLRQSDFSGVDRDALPQVDTDTFARLLSDRTNLSKSETKKLANRLYRTWQRNTNSSNGMNELMSFVATATGSQLASQGLGNQLSKLVGEMREQNARKSGGQQNSTSQDSNDGPSPIQQVVSQSMSSLIGMVMGKVDLPELDANTLVSQIKSAQSEILNQAGNAAPNALTEAISSNNTIKADVENYIQHAYLSELKSAALDNTFRNVLYDTEADGLELREQLSKIDRKVFTDALSARGMLTKSEIKDIATRMEIMRQSVIKDVMAAQVTESEKRVRQQLETFLKFTPASELSGDMGERAFRAIVESEPLEVAQVRDRLKPMNADYFRQFLTTRDDVAAHETAERYAQLLNRILADAEGVEKAAQVRLKQQQQSVENYLRNTGKPELNPDGIKRDLQKLLDEPDEGIRRIRGRVAHFDRDTLTSVLTQRGDFSEQDVDSVLNSVESNWNATMQTPQKLTNNAQMKYDEATSAIADYLRSTGKPELSPKGIERDLQKLIDNPKVGAQAIRFRLSKMDRDTLVQLLSARGDLSSSEVNQTIDSLLSNIQSIVKAPRRLARRAQSQTQSKALSFQSALEDYLGNTNKSELNPDGIKRDVKLLLNDPKLGASKLGDRLSQMDESTMVALLSQRSDMTQQEAEEVVGRITSVRSQISDQLRSMQQSLNSVLDSIFARIRDFLQSLDRPELDYYGIRRDVRTLFDDPKSGMSAISDRLSQFDRNTLVALVSTHNNISEADAYKVIDQVESARDSVVSKAEKLERQVESRLSAIKTQTHQQMEDTKKAAVAAAWWLFLTALISAVVAAFGGSLAIG